MGKLRDELRQTKPFSSLEEEVMLNLLRTADFLQYEIGRLLKRRGLTMPLYNCLRILRGAGAPGLPCSEIGKRLVSRVPDVTRLVDRLEEMGVAERHREDADRRVVRVRLTRKGHDLLRAVDPEANAQPRELLGHLDSGDLRRLNGILEAVRP